MKDSNEPRETLSAPVHPNVMPLPVPVLTPFAFIRKGQRSDGFDRHGVWEIVAADGLGTENERVTIQRIATARKACPLDEEWTFYLGQLTGEIEQVEWTTFLPSSWGGI